MFDNIFTPSPGVWGALIAGMIGLPILIHLINLMRHKTVKWAAMEFLLKSHKKNRKRVWLKQILLLLSRIAALLLVLFLLGRVGCNEDRIARLLGGATTHHYILIDDSFSMSDRAAGASAMDNARSTLSMIALRAKNRQNQRFTILRYSQARAGGNQEGAANAEVDGSTVDGSMLAGRADLNSELVNNRLEGRLETVKARLDSSNLAVGIGDALTTVASLVKEREDSNAIVYVLSDFRAKDWNNPDSVEPILRQIRDDGAAIELINCVTEEHPNLAVAELAAIGSVRVAGTPLKMSVTIRNCTDRVAEKVQVKIRTQTYPEPRSANDIGRIVPDFDDLPTVFIESIGPNESETREFWVSFPTPGQHAVVATLEDDAIAIDNTGRAVAVFRPAARVLMIESAVGDTGAPDSAFYLSLALNPRGSMTGITPEIRTKDFLRDASPDQLDEFDVVFLLDIDRLDESAVKHLESYAADGGGVCFFAGPNMNLSFYNSRSYRDGEGIFPVPLERQFDVSELIEDRVPDISPNEHSIFPPGMQNGLLDLVQVKTILKVPPEWQAADDSEVHIAATVRGSESLPLIVGSRFGSGNVLAFLTTVSPEWNNWARNGTFPPLMLLAEDFLARGRFPGTSDLVGVPIDVSVPAADYGPDVTFVVPDRLDSVASVEEQQRTETTQRMKVVSDRMLGESYRATLDGSADSAGVGTPGIYDIWLHRESLIPEVRRLALNVDSSESEMALARSGPLLTALDGASPSLVAWNEFNPEPEQRSSSSLIRVLLVLLVLVLVAEQWLAYLCSYHSKPRKNPESPHRQERAAA